jgi:serine/threonine protein kinase
MAYMQGGSLLTFLKEKKQDELDWHARLQIAKDVVQGLNFLHSELRTVHADIKSAIIMLDSNCRAKLGDFGISKTLKPDYVPIDGPCVGTSKWKAPELLEGGGIDLTTDMWSYGIVLWELCSHSEPFPEIQGGKISESQLAKHIRKGNQNEFPSATPECYATWARSFWSLYPKKRRPQKTLWNN